MDVVSSLRAPIPTRLDRIKEIERTSNWNLEKSKDPICNLEEAHLSVGQNGLIEIRFESFLRPGENGLHLDTIISRVEAPFFLGGDFVAEAVLANKERLEPVVLEKTVVFLGAIKNAYHDGVRYLALGRDLAENHWGYEYHAFWTWGFGPKHLIATARLLDA